MGPVEALEFAKSKEAEAAEMYQKMAIRFPQIEETFMFLKVEEEKHRKLIEEKITEITIK